LNTYGPLKQQSALAFPQHAQPILGKGIDPVLPAVFALHLISTAELARFYSATAQPVPVSMARVA
jgi:hypothetical protein